MKQSILLCGLILLIIPQVKSQDGTYVKVRDLETWSSVALTYKFNKRLKFSLSEHLRLQDNSSNVNQYFTEGELSYKFKKGLSFGLGARYIKQYDYKGKIQGYESHLRWNADLGFEHDIKRFTLKYRFRYQNKDELDKITDDPIKKYRIKLGLTYDIKKWKLDPTFSSEIFNGFSENEGFNKIRYTLGTEYKTKRLGEIGLFYRIEKELIGNYPITTNIIGFKYEYTIKRKKK